MIFMKKLVLFFLLFTIFIAKVGLSQSTNPTDFLPKEFHQQRREILRSKMPNNSVVVVFSNAIRNRANDVEFLVRTALQQSLLSAECEGHKIQKPHQNLYRLHDRVVLSHVIFQIEQCFFQIGASLLNYKQVTNLLYCKELLWKHGSFGFSF